ncbi:MAG TPA: hypothetical protein VM733_17680, partial [Thermoanaerobaculia bacterium]|nr:hypothetical protein [Thermoanaerobaculia bacterium]
KASISWLRSPLPKNDFARKYDSADYAGALASWRATPWQPVSSLDHAMLAHVLALGGDEAATPYIEALRPWEPVEADALSGVLLSRKGDFAGAGTLLASALTRYREDPWPLLSIMQTAITTAAETARDPRSADKVLDALAQPYAAYLLENPRGRAYLAAAWEARKCGTATLTALREYEPNVPWNASVLQMRVICYGAAGLQAQAAKAQEDLREFSEGELQALAP